MTNEEIKIKQQAVEFARKNKAIIAEERTNPKIFLSDEFPVSVFMAGSPGTGKTESSKNLIAKLSKDSHPVLRIDPDELRAKFPEYDGKNSSFSNMERSKENIKRSLDKKRFVQIVYVYQDPLQAWNFVKAREIKDGRKVPRDAFVKQYFMTRQNVNLLKEEFKGNIKIDLIIKNIDGTDYNSSENIDVIDNHIPEKYTMDVLEKLIM